MGTEGESLWETSELSSGIRDNSSILKSGGVNSAVLLRSVGDSQSSSVIAISTSFVLTAVLDLLAILVPNNDELGEVDIADELSSLIDREFSVRQLIGESWTSVEPLDLGAWSTNFAIDKHALVVFFGMSLGFDSLGESSWD